MAGGNADTSVAFKYCAPFTKCITPVGVNSTNSTSFKYILSFFKTLENDDNATFKKGKIAVLLKYLSNFWRSLKMSIINCKIHLELYWSKNCVVSNTVGARSFKITNTKFYVPIVTLSSKDNAKQVTSSEDRFNRLVYWNEYQTKIETRILDNNNLTRFLLNASFQGVRRLFVLASNNTDGGVNKVERNHHRKYFLPRVDVTNYNVLTDGRNFYDQPTNDAINKCDEIRKIATGQ